jgi:hypothetical protein
MLFGSFWSEGVLEPLVRFRPDLLDVGRAALGRFRVVGGIPGPSGKLEGFVLLQRTPLQRISTTP